MLEVGCYNCDSRDYFFYDSENGYNYVKCNNCGLIYLNPRPDNNEITNANRNGVHKGENEIDITGDYNTEKNKNYRSIISDFYSIKELQLRNLKWLDIGCGFGEFIEVLNTYSNSRLDIIGLEPNLKKVMSCKQRNLNVDYFDIYNTDEKFDFISLLNVYSHLPNPVEYLTKVKDILTPHGELFLETGHSSHLPPKRHHKPYYAPDHLSFANKKIIENILERIGFRIIKTKIYRHPQIVMKVSMKWFLILCFKLLTKKLSWRVLFPHPHGDMYIRAKKIY